MKVFLGGTCNNSNWRELVIKNLEIDYFDPVVDDWDEAAYEEELRERELCDYCLYVITPKMTGVYSIAELVDDSHKRPEKTIFFFTKNDGGKSFDEHQIKSLQKVGKMVEENGAKFFNNAVQLYKYLNGK